jgi:hypothetical protein
MGAKSSALGPQKEISKYEFYGKFNFFLWLQFSDLVGYFTNWQMHSHMLVFQSSEGTQNRRKKGLLNINLEKTNNNVYHHMDKIPMSECIKLGAKIMKYADEIVPI